LDVPYRSGGWSACETDHARKDPGGIIITMLLSIAGSLVAGFLDALGWYEAGQGAD
jgi:uncharacterized membrane protein YeaQ/YmgE (transglycosylase-associated protein family)